MYYIFLLTSLLSVCANSFAMDKKYPLLQIKSEGFLGKPIVKNSSKKPFFLKDLSLLRLSPEAIRNSEILTRLIDDETNITNTLPFKKQDIPHILSIVHNNIDTIAEKDLERSFEIANYLDVPNNILFPLAQRYTCSWSTKNKNLIALAKKCGSLAQLSYDELAHYITITNDPLTYDVQCSIDLENKNLYSLHGFEKFFKLIENKNIVTKVSLKNNKLVLLNAELFLKFPNLKVIDISQNNLTSRQISKAYLLLKAHAPLTHPLKYSMKAYLKFIAYGLFTTATMTSPIYLYRHGLNPFNLNVLLAVTSMWGYTITAKLFFEESDNIQLNDVKIINDSQKTTKK